MRTRYVNGRVHASDATALLVADGSIAWLGDSSAVPAADQTVDLGGGLVTPAFVDAHVHATGTGLTLTGLDLAGAASLTDALDLVERHARALRGRLVLGHGWDETRWPQRRPPTRTELDRASYGGAVYLSRVDVHSAVVSSALLAAAPHARALPGFRADGWLRLDAHHAVRAAAFGDLRPVQVRDAQRATRAHAASLGIGCVHEMAGPEVSSAGDLAGLLALAAAEPGPEVIGYWGELLGIDTARELGAAGAGGDLFVDGSLGSHTAALTSPYADAPQTAGELRFSTDEIAEHVRRCTEAGLQAGFHAIGDAAVDAILDAVGPCGGSGHRIEHVEMVRDPARFAASGLTASVQPGFDAAWGRRSGMYAQRLGADRAAGLNRFAALAEQGVPLAFGSDSPVTPMGPWAAVQAAVHPQVPEAALRPRAAFEAHTRGGWRAAGRDGGELRVGAPANFAVWQAGELAADGLPDLCPGAELPACLRTVVRGETVYLA